MCHVVSHVPTKPTDNHAVVIGLIEDDEVLVSCEASLTVPISHVNPQLVTSAVCQLMYDVKTGPVVALSVTESVFVCLPVLIEALNSVNSSLDDGETSG